MAQSAADGFPAGLSSAGAAASGSLQTISQSLSAAVDASAAQATAALAGSGDLGRGVALAAEALASGEVQPHFGSVAVAQGVEALVSWVGSRFTGLELLDPETAASLTSALSDLRGVAGVMTLPPALGGRDRDIVRRTICATAVRPE